MEIQGYAADALGVIFLIGIMIAASLFDNMGKSAAKKKQQEKKTRRPRYTPPPIRSQGGDAHPESPDDASFPPFPPKSAPQTPGELLRQMLSGELQAPGIPPARPRPHPYQQTAEDPMMTRSREAEPVTELSPPPLSAPAPEPKAARRLEMMQAEIESLKHAASVKRQEGRRTVETYSRKQHRRAGKDTQGATFKPSLAIVERINHATRDRHRLREAVVMSEILQKPLALRGPGGFERR